MRSLFVALVLFAPLVFAADTVAFGNRVVTTGDPISKVLEAAGQPSRRVRLENEQGAAVGERWEYVLRGKTVLLTLSGGRVVAIDEIR